MKAISAMCGIFISSLKICRHSGESRNPDDQNFSRKRARIKALSASQSISYDWIPAFAGMTAAAEDMRHDFPKA
jgi:hypothetical protein